MKILNVFFGSFLPQDLECLAVGGLVVGRHRQTATIFVLLTLLFQTGDYLIILWWHLKLELLLRVRHRQVNVCSKFVHFPKIWTRGRFIMWYVSFHFISFSFLSLIYLSVCRWNSGWWSTNSKVSITFYHHRWRHHQKGKLFKVPKTSISVDIDSEGWGETLFLTAQWFQSLDHNSREFIKQNSKNFDVFSWKFKDTLLACAFNSLE